MTVVVIEAPKPILNVNEVKSALGISGNDDDLRIAALIAAATEEIDGPGGWLGRAIGPQILELRQDCFIRSGSVVIVLPYPPLIEVLSVTYSDAEGIDQTFDPLSYGIVAGTGIYPKPGFAWPSVSRLPGSARVRYKAGYNDVPVAGGGTGPVPERIKQAIILTVGELRSVSTESLFLRSETVDGVGSQQFTVSDAASAVIKTAVRRLLSNLRIRSL